MSGRKGNQTPTQSVFLPGKKSLAGAAIKLYEASGRKAIQWQKDLLKGIMTVGSDGLWVHQKFGFQLPRRNGKNEVIAAREIYGLVNGELICHTSHRVSSAHQAWERLRRILCDAGYEELGRRTKDEVPSPHSFHTTKALGLETIEMTEGGGRAVFRTRTVSGGLGEGFDLLVIDEAQEYTIAQQAALTYTVSDSRNPQTIFCGTPPTTESAGTVFADMRKATLNGEAYDTGWAEWSVEERPKDLMDVDLWYLTNPSMGYHLNERKIRAEYDPHNELDFIIQRLGYWFQYSLKSVITEAEWRASEVSSRPELQEQRFFGVKFGKDGANGCLAVASRTLDGKIFVEAIDCRPIRGGIDWMIPFLQNPNCAGIAIDGDSGKQMLLDLMREQRVKRTATIPTVREIIDANAAFEAAIFGDGIEHIDQAALRNAISNCDHRPIGSSGGFGYKTQNDQYEVALIESVSLAHWLCSQFKGKKKQAIRY